MLSSKVFEAIYKSDDATALQLVKENDSNPWLNVINRHGQVKHNSYEHHYKFSTSQLYIVQHVMDVFICWTTWSVSEEISTNQKVEKNLQLYTVGLFSPQFLIFFKGLLGVAI